MNPTLSGSITFICLLVACFYVVWPTKENAKHMAVVKSWYLLFALFLYVTAALFAPPASSRLLVTWYALPVICAASWFCWTFRDMRSLAAYIFAAIFIVNLIGLEAGLHRWKLVATIDILDVLGWFQIGLLIQLGRQHPDPVLSKPYAPYTQKDNLLRMVRHVRRITDRAT